MSSATHDSGGPQQQPKDYQDRLHAALEGLAEGVLELDAEGRILYTNSALREMFEGAADNCVGGFPSAFMGGDWEGPQSDAWRHALLREGGRELEGRRPDGSRFPLRISLCKEPHGDGTYAWVACVKDLSQERKSAEQLALALDAAEQANLAKSEFLAKISHEIRTPLAAIVGYADLLQQSAADHPERETWVAQLRTNGAHLTDLVNDLLDLSCIEAHRMHIESEEASPHEVIEQVAELARTEAMAKGLSFELRYASELPLHVMTDPLRVRQIVLNLATNAVKFTEHGSVVLQAEVRQDEQAHYQLAIELADTGVGIDAADLEQIFEPFHQAHGAAARYGGTGMGLAVSRQIAELLGGELSVQSERGRGSRFCLTLPLGEECPELVAVEDWQERREASRLVCADSAGHYDLSRLRVLVVEDGRDNQRILRFLLEQAGAHVLVADNGHAGLSSALAAQRAKKAYDLILMDMQMPVMDGWEATQALRERGIQTPIIALTAFAMTGDRKRCLDAGCSAYLSKPIDTNALFATIGELLGIEADRTRQPDPAPALPSAGAGEASGAEAPAAELDPLQALIAEFARGLAPQAEQIEGAYRAGEADELRTLVHRLAGSAASFGFPRISDLARSCEEPLREGGELKSIRRPLASLLRQMREAGKQAA